MNRKTMKLISLLCCTVILALALAACGNSTNNATNNSTTNKVNTSSQEVKEEPIKEDPIKEVTITVLVDNTQDAVNGGNAIIDAFQKVHPNIKVEMETRPGGTEGDNWVKTSLATGDMSDVFFYNSGSLLQALLPEQNLLDLTNEPFMDKVMDSFESTVAQNGKVYGVPVGSAMAGGWFYNKKVYADLSLSVPATWDELMTNNEKIKAAGITPVIETFKDSWTSQLIVLADYYHVQAANSTFAEDYTANKAHYTDTPAALRSFEKLAEVFEKGYMNKDYLATTFDAGLKMLAEGTGAHYPMLSFAVPAIEQNYPELIDNIGFFAQPGDNANDNGLTIWMPDAAYIYKNSKHPEEAKTFLDFIASPEGMAAMATVSKPTGPYLVEGAVIPDNVANVVKDMLPYFDANKTAPALEFVSPLKGPNLEQITVEVGAGITTPNKGADTYDHDVQKQAKQLGLEGW